jgi:hypothetical protein
MYPGSAKSGLYVRFCQIQLNVIVHNLEKCVLQIAVGRTSKSIGGWGFAPYSYWGLTSSPAPFVLGVHCFAARGEGTSSDAGREGWRGEGGRSHARPHVSRGIPAYMMNQLATRL